MDKKQMQKMRLDLFINSCKAETFTDNLRRILEENFISQTELAKAIGVDNQTISNWLNANIKYRPKWVDYMFKLNEFFYRRIDNYNPLDLFTSNISITEQTKEYYKRRTDQITGRLKSQANDRYIAILQAANDRLENGEEWKGVDYKNLFVNMKFYQLIEKINNNYCKALIGERININSKECLQRELFDFIVEFLEKTNKKLEDKKNK